MDPAASVWRGAAALFLLALALTLLLAAPVLRHPTERLFGNEIVGRHHDAYTMIRLFEKPGTGRIRQPATDLFGNLAARFIGGVATVNLIVLASFPLAALFAYLLARHLGAGPVVGGVAAMIYAFSPLHLAHAAYHPHIVQTQWIPLYLLALWRCLDRWSPGRAALLLAAGALMALTNFYAAFFGGLLTPIALAAYWLAAPGGRRSAPALRRTLLTLGAGGGVGLLWAAAAARRLGPILRSFAFPLADLQRYSARWWSYLLPPIEHPVAGAWARDLWATRGIADGVLEQQVGLGLAVPALALLTALSWLAGRREGRLRRATPALVVVAAAAFLASLGPGATLGPWHLPMPSELLHAVLPIFRAYARFAVFLQLMLALLAAAALGELSRGGANGRLAAALLAALALFELTPWPPWRWHSVLPTRAHEWLARQPGDARPLDCVPASLPTEVNVPYLYPGRLARLDGPGLAVGLSDCTEPELAPKLAAIGLTHVILRSESPDGRTVAAYGPPPGFAEVAVFPDSRVLAVTAEPALVLVERLAGFSWREHRGRSSYRWMGDAGQIVLLNRLGRPTAGRFVMELLSFPDERGVTVRLRDAVVAEWEVGPDREDFVTGPLALQPGSNVLSILPSGPPVKPDSVLANRDFRGVTISLWDWRWIPLEPAG